MGKLKLFAKLKKGFTLVELIVVMAIMAIGAALIYPNLSGVISESEFDKVKTYCMTASSYVRNYANNLTSGVTKVAYEDKDGNTAYYTITTVDGLRGALNEYNSDPAYQFYVLDFASQFKTDPTGKIYNEIKDKKIAEKDTIVVCIESKASGAGYTYTLKGLFYYAYAKECVVCTYVNRTANKGFVSITSTK